MEWIGLKTGRGGELEMGLNPQVNGTGEDDEKDEVVVGWVLKY